MAEQVRNLIAKWSAAWPSPLIISRQRDNGQFRINLVDYPEPENYEDQSEEVLETISYYLTVWMKQTEDGEIEKLAPIQLPGPYWRVYSPYTQLVQCIKFQFFATSSVTGYIGHSAIFTGLVLDSLEEDGEDIGVIPAEMWDAYKQYIEDKIIAAGVTTIDQTLSIQGAAADAKATGDAIAEVNGRLDSLGGGVPTEVRQAILTLFQSAAYAETGLTDEVAVIASWAAVVTAISLNQSSISISGANTSQLVATTTPTGGTVSWASSDTSVATVSSSGLVTGIGNGTATITASCGDKKATCSVTVSGFASLTGIEATYTQTATITESSSLSDLTSDLVVTATYDDSSTATLSSSDYTLSGTLTDGTSTITVTYGSYSDTFDVTVTTPLYQLTNGTHEFTSSYIGYVTISDNEHIVAERTTSGGTNGYNYCNLSDLNANGTSIKENSNINNHSTIFSLASGDVVRFVVSNVTGDFDDYTIGLRKASATTSAAAVSDQTTDCDTEVNISSAVDVGCLFVYFGTAEQTSDIGGIEFDIAVYVNNVRYF